MTFTVSVGLRRSARKRRPEFHFLQSSTFYGRNSDAIFGEISRNSRILITTHTFVQVVHDQARPRAHGDLITTVYFSYGALP
jgi:hypothetical protein